jgi:hypothetical protein
LISNQFQTPLPITVPGAHLAATPAASVLHRGAPSTRAHRLQAGAGHTTPPGRRAAPPPTPLPHSLPPRGALRRLSPTSSCPFKRGAAPSSPFSFFSPSSCSSQAHLEPPHPSLFLATASPLPFTVRTAIARCSSNWSPPSRLSLSHARRAAGAPQAAADPRGSSTPLECHRLSSTEPPHRRQPSSGELRSP